MFFNVSLIWFNFWILEILSNLGISSKTQSSSIGKLSTYRHPRLAFPISQRPLVGSVCIWITRWPTRAFSTNVCREINGRSGRGPPSRQGKQARKVEIKAGLSEQGRFMDRRIDFPLLKREISREEILINSSSCKMKWKHV